MAGDGFAPTGHEFNTEDLLLSDAMHAALPGPVATEAQSVREAMLRLAPPTGEADAVWLHGDFELDNLFWHNDGITAIDFGDFFRGPRFLDVALALRDLPPVDGREANGAQAFLDGYNTASPAHPVDPELVALGRRFAGLVIYAGLVQALDLNPDENYPDWLRALERKLSQHVERFEASLR